MKRTLLLIVLCLFAGIAAAGENRTAIPLEGSPSLGPADAPVIIVEFIDFQ